MKGEAKATSGQDRTKLETKTAQLESKGRADSRVPLGEDSIETSVPTEELTAKAVPGGAAPAVAMPTVAGAAPSEEVAIVAQEQDGAQIDAALAKASADVATERAKHAQEDQKARADADKQIRDLKTKADADQAAARTAAKAESEKARGEWQSEIDKKGADARKQADALIVAIPMALVAILIEKLVAMIVPAAGALMAIIEGLQAAWGTVSRIIAAFSAFMAFLSAVQGGGAGPQFATALASAAVVVLDFVANWLLKKLRGPASKVGRKLEGMAGKLKGKGSHRFTSSRSVVCSRKRRPTLRTRRRSRRRGPGRRRPRRGGRRRGSRARRRAGCPRGAPRAGGRRRRPRGASS